jgi:hypothetical protein
MSTTSGRVCHTWSSHLLEAQLRRVHHQKKGLPESEGSSNEKLCTDKLRVHVRVHHQRKGLPESEGSSNEKLCTDKLRVHVRVHHCLAFIGGLLSLAHASRCTFPAPNSTRESQSCMQMQKQRAWPGHKEVRRVRQFHLCARNRPQRNFKMTASSLMSAGLQKRNRPEARLCPSPHRTHTHSGTDTGTDTPTPRHPQHLDTDIGTDIDTDTGGTNRR